MADLPTYTRNLWIGLKGFTIDGFLYNLKVFPDTLTAAAFVFSILFQSPPIATFAGSILILNLLHPLFGRFLASVFGGMAGVNTDVESCSSRFPGISFEGLMTMARERKFGAINYTTTPSYYTMFLGFIAAYLGLMQLIYSREFESSPKRKAITITGLVVLSIVAVAGVLFRALSGCDSPFGVVVGISSGFIVGAAVVLLLAWISDRRLTNLLGFPLIRSKAHDGKPIYVCERPGVVAGKK